MTRSARPLLLVAVLVLVSAVALAVTRMVGGDGSEVVASGSDREEPAALPDGAPDPPSDDETPGRVAEADAADGDAATPDGEAAEADAADAPDGDAAAPDREAQEPDGEAAAPDRQAIDTESLGTVDPAEQAHDPAQGEGESPVTDPDRTDADPSGPLPDTGPAGGWTAIGAVVLAAAAGGSRPRRGR